jgi:Ca-activated chloride channel family protein
MAQSDRVIARSDVQVTSVSASFDVPDTLMVDTPVDINWEGPNNPSDYVSLAERGAPDGAYVTYTRTRQGDPLTIRTPETPGQYELRYVMAQSDRVIARKPIVVLPLQARLRAPDSAAAGTGVKVSWIGPNGPDDFIAVATPEASATDYESRALSRAGTPATVFAPSTPGPYELRYVWAEEDSVLTRTPLTVTQE